MKTTAFFYLAAIIVSIIAIYYIYQVEYQPQPYVSMTYNSSLQFGMGYVNNTLPYPIRIETIYCTAPGGQKEAFGDPNNNTLASGSNTTIEVGTAMNITIPDGCSDWGITYVRLAANNTVQNSPIVQRS